MPVLIAIAAISLIAELSGIIRCAINGIPIGRSFGIAILAQFALPFLLFALFFLWCFVSPPTHGVEPLAGEAFERGFDFIAAVFWFEFLAAVVAGWFGVTKFLVVPHVADKAHNM